MSMPFLNSNYLFFNPCLSHSFLSKKIEAGKTSLNIPVFPKCVSLLWTQDVQSDSNQVFFLSFLFFSFLFFNTSLCTLHAKYPDYLILIVLHMSMPVPENFREKGTIYSKLGTFIMVKTIWRRKHAHLYHHLSLHLKTWRSLRKHL